VWGREPFLRFGGGGGEYFVLDYEPEYMPLSEQTEVAARRIVELPRFSFLLRPATEEGSVSESISKLTIRKAIEDPTTNEYDFPDETQINQLKAWLSKRSGIPIATILAEQEARLKTPLAVPVPLRKEEATHPDGIGTQLPPGETTPPSPRKERGSPHLEEEEATFLRFLIQQPDSPISVVYQSLGISWRKGNQLREHLREQGFITELDGRSSKGRKTSVLIPTGAAFDLLGVAPLAGRGSPLHRYLQNLVKEGAIAKGYSAHVEKPIGNGAIVDVHLEKDGVKMAVEIAVWSRAELELAHLKHCLAFGYTSVFGIFVDEKLMTRTAEAMQEVLSGEERSKVRLLPVSRLAHLG
jgi:hypothetical protein